MGIYYFYFGRDTKECLSLGKKVTVRSPEFEGPGVILSGQRYLLPEKYLQLVIERFRANNPSGALLLPDYELLDSTDYIPEDELAVVVGGDNIGDPPLTKYFPELQQYSVRDEIQRAGMSA